MTDTYDCTPHPKPEAIHKHVARVVHNLFHPHHKQFYIAPMTLACKIPDMETVTITASQKDPNVQFPSDDQSGGSYLYGNGGYGYWYDSCHFCVLTVPPQTTPPPTVSVPEPGTLMLLAAGLIAVFIANLRHKRKLK